MKNHNRGPIGPLDPDEPPPFPYDNLRRDSKLTVTQATRLLRSMGSSIGDRDIEYFINEGSGPPHALVSERVVEWGPLLDWANNQLPREDELTRKEAFEYLRSKGCPMSNVTLQQLGHGGPPYRVIEGRGSYYRKEDLDKWWEQRKATWPAWSFERAKYRPFNSKSQCPESHRAEGHCPSIKHPECSKYPRALCNVMHLPVRPGSPRTDWLPEPCFGWVGKEPAFYRLIEGKKVIVRKLSAEEIDCLGKLKGSRLYKLLSEG